MTNAVNLASAAGTGFTFRNRIINGDMRIDQRNGGALVAAATGYQYPVDRCRSYNGLPTGRWTAQQVSDAPSGFTNSFKLTITTAQSSLAANDLGQSLEQPIEGLNINDLDWGLSTAKPITISFWVKSSVAGTYGLGVFNGAFTRSYITTYTINAANTWEYKTITVPGATTGVWNTNTAVGMYVAFNMCSGSNFITTANAWQTGQFFGVAGTTNLCATNGATWQLTGFQVEVGSVATPFERRPYGLELTLCQRYLETINTLFQTCSNAGFNNSYINTILYKVQKRAVPTVNIYSAQNLAGTVGAFTFYPGIVLGGCNIEAQSVDGIALSRLGVNSYDLMTGSMIALAEL